MHDIGLKDYIPSACKQIYFLFIFSELKSYQKSTVWSWSVSCHHHVTILCTGKFWCDLIGQVLQIIQSDQVINDWWQRINVISYQIHYKTTHSFNVQPCTPNNKQHSRVDIYLAMYFPSFLKIWYSWQTVITQPLLSY